MRGVVLALAVLAAAAIGFALYASRTDADDEHRRDAEYATLELDNYVCQHDDSRYCHAPVSVEHVDGSLWRMRYASRRLPDRCFLIDLDRFGGRPGGASEPGAAVSAAYLGAAEAYCRTNAVMPPSAECYATDACGEAVAFVLHSHCGGVSALVDGERWMATPPLFNASRTGPPAGWGNPVTEGAFRRLSANRAEFVSKTGQVARFERAPPGWDPPDCD